MQHHIRSSCISAAFLTVGVTAPLALADINGFGNFSQFSINQWDGGEAPTPVGSGIRLTSQSADQSRSIFHVDRQPITQFSASYTYRSGGAPTNQFGGCFVIQNSTAGAQSVAAAVISGVGTKFGYSDFFGTFHHSVAMSLEYGSLALPSSSTAGYTNGNVGGGSASTSPLNLFSNNPINVTLNYDGFVLTQRLVDTVTGAVHETGSFFNIPQIVGGQTAYVGFVAASQRNSNTEQVFSNFQFQAVPAPSAGLVLGGAGLLAGRRRRPG